jgi:hypothetical protein
MNPIEFIGPRIIGYETDIAREPTEMEEDLCFHLQKSPVMGCPYLPTDAAISKVEVLKYYLHKDAIFAHEPSYYESVAEIPTVRDICFPNGSFKHEWDGYTNIRVDDKNVDTVWLTSNGAKLVKLSVIDGVVELFDKAVLTTVGTGYTDKKLTSINDVSLAFTADCIVLETNMRNYYGRRDLVILNVSIPTPSKDNRLFSIIKFQGVLKLACYEGDEEVEEEPL